MAIPLKGLNQIRTHSGRVNQISVPYRRYMQITRIEIEKARRNAERASASQRIELIDARLEEIEAIKQELLRAVSETAEPQREQQADAPKAVRSDPLPTHSSRAAITIRY